jgi:hypothetical protein
MKKRILLFCVLTFILLCSCNEKTEKKNIVLENEISNQKEIDSIEITKLTRQVYEWHNRISIEDFPYKFNEEHDSIFVGIDWKEYQKNIEVFKQTNYFSNEFLNKHKEIAKTLDSSIKKADIIWRNSNDGMSLWETGADNWCGCQDYNEKYWETITIDKLNINKSEANFNWSLDKYNSHSYKVTVKKENGRWKINKLDGFKYFYSIEEYDEMMKK